MRNILFSILLFICYPSLYSQVITANDFFTLISLPEKKIQSYVSKKGFVQIVRNIDKGNLVQEFFYSEKKKRPVDSIVRYLSRSIMKESAGVAYQTSSAAEYIAILKELNEKGFVCGNEKPDSSLFFQKNNITVRVNDEMQDELKIYKFQIDRKEIPSVKYADDLLSFDSHENLVFVFGKENVKKDVYYFSEKETTRCSVLFPNTNRQAIFIWEDQANDRKLSFIMIGGSLRSESLLDFNGQIPMNVWRCRNGLIPGMKVKEVIEMNKNDFDFYGENSEFTFMAVPEKRGIIDFKKTGIVLACLNCVNTPAMSLKKVSAETATDNDLNMYVLSIILIP